ncbi:MAG: DUF4402 domain-containing protein [Ignavibacteriales bacterium]|nr:DUF4402 domain-containing protein [Ignavibacteriales bacterium]
MKRIFVIALVLCAISVASFAQTTTANVTANVTATLTITKITDLNLGNVSQGATVTITSLTAGAATFTIQGAGSAGTTVTVTNPATLLFGAIPMTFTAQIPRYNTVNTQSSSSAFGATTGGSTTTSVGGQLFLWIGGSVTAAAAQSVGSYSGVITVSVAQP